MKAANRLPIRIRVAASFAVATAIALAALGTFVYVRVDNTLTQQSREAMAIQLDALARVPRPGRADATTSMTGEFFAQITTPEGRLVASSPQVSGSVLNTDDVARSTRVNQAVDRPVRLVGEEEPEGSLLLVRRVSDQVLVIGTSQSRTEDALGGIQAQFFVGGPLALILASGLGYLVAGSALRPVERMRRRAAEISSTSTGSRLPLPVAHDEIHRLGSTLNGMLDRLDSAVQQQRRFVAEASHELRTPLSLLRVELDLALSRPRSRDELVTALTSANEEVSRLTALSEGLLTVAATDQSPLPLDLADVDIDQLVHGVAQRFSPRAAAEGRRIEVRADGSLAIRGDAVRLEQALGNLVDNALRHGDTDVCLDVSSQPHQVTIRVRDRGPGLSVDLRQRAFDPFSRDGGSRPGRGHGLGLAIVDAIITAHGGTTTIGPRSDGPGTEATLTLPAAPS